MPYEIETVDLEVLETPLRQRYRRWHQLAELKVGEGLRVPDSELSRCALDPTGTMRTVAWAYGRKLGRIFRTQRQLTGAVLIYRVS